MNQYLGYAVSKRLVSIGRPWCLVRTAAWLIAVFAGVWIGFGAKAEAAPAQRHPENSPVNLIQTGLGDASITTVPSEKFADAVKQAVAVRPRLSAAILTAALSVERKDGALIAGQLVGAAIEGLGPKAGESSVTALVRLGVELRPSAVLLIVRAAVRASPNSFTQAIINAAVLSLKNPSHQIIARINLVAAKAKSGEGTDNGELGLESVDNPFYQNVALDGGAYGIAPNCIAMPTPSCSPRPTPTPPPHPSCW